MKTKFFLLILLLNNTVYCQYKEGYSWNSGVRDEIIKCYGYNCQNGIYSQMEDVKCTNCAGWADSYRNSRGCDVCHNNKYINKRVTYTCYTCNGLGKVRNTYYTKENIADREKSYRIQENKKKCEELKTLSFPNKDQIASDLIGKKISTWKFDKLEEFKDISIYDASRNINYDNPEESSFKIKVGLQLEDYKTKEFYVGDVVVNYKFKDHKWFFSEIISGWVINFEGEERIGAKSDKITIKKDDYSL